MKPILKIILAAVILLTVVVLASASVAFILNQSPEDRPEGNFTFTVDKGEPVQAIAKRLATEKLIRSPLLLRVLAKLKATEASFQSGSYLIVEGASTLTVHDTLVSGVEILQKVTIPEGWTISRVADALADAEITNATDFLEVSRDRNVLDEIGIVGGSAEGFLFPDTYLFPKDYPAEKVLRQIVRSFFDALQEVEPNYRVLSGEELLKKIVMASIIEREYVQEQEAPLMASVFYNRLAIGMKLQSCATVAYALSEETGREHPESLTLRDLEVQSVFNTYLYEGMPPGPIANPGRVALQAAFHPAETDYLFFLLRDPETGEHEFTKNYSEHLTAKSLYLKKS